MREIVSAKDSRSGPFPFMGTVLSGWQNMMNFKKVTDTIVDFEVSKSEESFPFKGVFQPMSSRDLMSKAEGQRAWRWWTLWVRTGKDIQVGDIIEDFNARRFKVMRSNDWEQAGYAQYDLLEDYITYDE